MTDDVTVDPTVEEPNDDSEVPDSTADPVDDDQGGS